MAIYIYVYVYRFNSFVHNRVECSPSIDMSSQSYEREEKKKIVKEEKKKETILKRHFTYSSNDLSAFFLRNS